MHQIRLELGLHPKLRYGSSHHFPDLLVEFMGPMSKERNGRKREGKKAREKREAN